MTLLDLDTLLRPIPGDLPCGESLRDSPLHDELRELRREEDAQAPRGVWRRKLKAAEWPAVIAATGTALAERSKDLQLAAWLVEAMAARHGLAGAAEGLAVLSGLVERFWPGLWPLPATDGEDEDAEEDPRFTILEWLDARLTERLMLQPLTSVGEPPPSWHERASLLRRRSVGQGRVPPEEAERDAALEKAIARTTDAEFQETHAQVLRLRRAAQALVAALGRAGVAAPPSFPQLGTMLDSLEGFLRAELTKRGALPAPLATLPETALPVPDATPAPEPGDLPMPPPAGPIADRDAAYRQIEAVARYLEAVEPHSPVPALLRRAIRWGEMRLPDLLAELMQEEGGPFRLLRIAPGEAPPARR